MAMLAARQYGGARSFAAKIWTVPLMVAFCATYGRSKPSKPHDPFEMFARACGVSDAMQRKPRVFASPDESSWHEYPSLKEIPEWAGEWTETASVWRGGDSPTLVVIVGARHEFADYSYYCYNRQGILFRVKREFRTAWRWGFAESIFYDGKGNEEERTSSYFDTRDEHTIEPPKESGRVTPVKIFRQVTSLPFFPLLSSNNSQP
jgi:hypothetical protein